MDFDQVAQNWIVCTSRFSGLFGVSTRETEFVELEIKSDEPLGWSIKLRDV